MTGFNSLAQNIPNGDFEEWLTGLYDPPYWTTNNIYPPPLECRQVFMGSPPYSGDFCIEGIVDSCPELNVLFPPLIQSDDIPLNSKPEALHGFYKFIPIEEDLFAASIQTFFDNNLIGEGTITSQQLVSDFTEFIINIEYTTSDIPDVAIIKFTIDTSITSNKLHQGSKWYIDSLFFGPLSDIDNEQADIPNTLYLYQNFPNPFNPITSIQYTVSSRQIVIIKVYDVLGKEIAALVNEEKPAGRYEIEFDATGLPSGVYFYQLKAPNPSISSGQGFVETKKMILLK
jgi:hypothetical protein